MTKVNRHNSINVIRYVTIIYFFEVASKQILFSTLVLWPFLARQHLHLNVCWVVLK